MNMKNSFLTLFSALIFLIATQPVHAGLVILDEIGAIVDEDVIMTSEIEIRRKAIKAQLSNSKQQLPPEAALNKQIIERLVVESLQLQMAERAGVRISDEELNDAMLRIADQNQMSLAEFQQELIGEGLSYIDMRNQVRREISISRVQQGVMRRRIQISEQEIKTFLASELGSTITADEYRLAHILLPFPEDANSSQIQTVKTQAMALIQSINDGADFKSLALTQSAATNANDFGDLGWRKAIQLPTIFADVALTMQPNDIDGPIKSGSGYHIIKMLDRRGATAEGQVPQTQVRHVLITPSEIRSESECKEFAETLREEVIQGRPFEEIATLHSDDPGSALSGGDLGWSRRGIFVPEFEDHLLKAEIDEISGVFRTVHGYHFLQVTGRRIEDFSEVFKLRQAENFLRSQKFEEELQSWLMEIREDAFVEIRI
ncbi:MAG: peptidylprolyl isomerase [Pseudomonadales bacterium]|nr:peptidylprolyl isomerase [Pseudomonadales bacterium]